MFELFFFFRKKKVTEKTGCGQKRSDKPGSAGIYHHPEYSLFFMHRSRHEVRKNT